MLPPRSTLLSLLLLITTTSATSLPDLSSPHHLLAHLSSLMSNITSISSTRPHVEPGPPGTVVLAEGEEAVVRCEVWHQANYTVMWSKAHRAGDRLLTVNGETVTRDGRVGVVHEERKEEKDNYLLTISSLTAADSGLYTCEVNTEPPLRSFYQLEVVAVVEEVSSSPLSCCAARNVTAACRGFCSVDSVLAGDVGSSPAACEAEFPAIVSCMADGRDHQPCCATAGVPPACRDMCRGEYTVVTDHLRSQFDCSRHLRPTLACISEGLRALPRRPTQLVVEPVNDTALLVYWASPAQPTHTTFQVNVTFLHKLQSVYSLYDSVRPGGEGEHAATILLTLPTNQTRVEVAGLKVFSLYTVSVLAENLEGRSLPSYSVRAATLLKGAEVDKGFVMAPSLPDTAACCARSEVPERCRRRFCDPLGLATVTEEDVVECGRYSTPIFACIADGADHSPCCQARGVPAPCHSLCSGSQTALSAALLCLPQLPEVASCLVEGLGVLPSAPTSLRYSNSHPTWGLLQWAAPATLGDTVIHYTVGLREEGGAWELATGLHSPHVLDHLRPGATYQVWVEGLNSHGRGARSTTLELSTPPLEVEVPAYSQGDCCRAALMRPECRPLCDYNVTLATLELLAPHCGDELSVVVRCAAGGRDHAPCCQQRGVPAACNALCRGVDHGAFLTHECMTHIGQVVQCWEEGVGALPAPPEGVKAVVVATDQATIAWTQGREEEGAPSDYYNLYYKHFNGSQNATSLFSGATVLNTTDTMVTVSGLEKDQVYQFFVVGVNGAGRSLPSSVVTVAASMAAWEGRVEGAPSPPHQLRVDGKSVDWIQVSWSPPTISSPSQPLHYLLHYTLANSSRTLSTPLTNVRLASLPASTLVRVAVTAVATTREGQERESRRSEEVEVWTDAMVPATVEVRVVRHGGAPRGAFHPSLILGALFHGLAPHREESVRRVREGEGVTVICRAEGRPRPAVALYVGGELVMSEQRTSYMAAVVHSLRRTMAEVRCIADNGVAATAETRLIIETKPEVEAPRTAMVVEGRRLELRCTATGTPLPHIAIKRANHTNQSMPHGSLVTRSTANSTTSLLTFTLESATLAASGVYLCTANSTLGNSSAPVVVHVTPRPSRDSDVRRCCEARGVAAACLQLCTLDQELDWWAVTAACLGNFHQVMACASDGGDHRHCCTEGGVPSAALDWCRGDATHSTAVLALAHSSAIQKCFKEGVAGLPGRPTNVTVRALGHQRALLAWGVPDKNPDMVELYRVYWRKVGEEVVSKADTARRSLAMEGLEEGARYEASVKAGNGQGTSQLTDILYFVYKEPKVIASTDMDLALDTGMEASVSTSTTTATPSVSSPSTSPPATPSTSPPATPTTPASLPIATTLSSSAVPLLDSSTNFHSVSSILIPLLAILALVILSILLLERRRRSMARRAAPPSRSESPVVAFGSPGTEPSVELRSTPSPREPAPSLPSLVASLLRIPRATRGFTRFQ